MKHAIRSSLESHSFSSLLVKLVITPLLIHNLALSTLGIQTLLLVVVGLLCEDHSLIYSTYHTKISVTRICVVTVYHHKVELPKTQFEILVVIKVAQNCLHSASPVLV